jgi:hypothetical protein
MQCVMITILTMKQCVLYAVLLFPEFSDIHSFTRVVQRNCRQEIYVVRTVHFGMKLYNDQRNAQSPGYGVSARALTPYPGDLNHCRSCTPASEDGLKESPKHVRQK